MGAISEYLEKRATWQQGGSPQTPQYWVRKMFGAAETSSGIQVDEDKALSYSAIWAAINIISGALGFLPMKIYRRKGSDKELDAKHSSYKLLHDRPNPYMDALTFRELLQGHVLTWGNGYAEIERDGGGRALALWPLLPNRVEPQVTESGHIRYKVTLKNGGTAYLPYVNCLHIKGLSFDGIKGYSVIHYARESVAFGLAAEKYGAAFFGNDSRPGGVLEHPKTLSKPAQARLKESWEQDHRSLDDKHRVEVLEEGMKWHQIGIPPEEAQFLQTRKFEVADVARWYTIPLHMLAEMDKATFSNIEHQGIEFVTWTLAKWLKRWELECSYKLLRQDEQPTHFFEFLVDALLRGDTKSRYEAYKIARTGGFFSINDIRRKENMNSIEGGDTYLEPLNYKPVGAPWPAAAPKGTRNTIAVRELLEHTWERILTKEANALRKTLKKPESFGSRVEEFYSKFIEHIQSVFEPVVRAYLETEDEKALMEKVAGEYVARHRQAIGALVEGENGDELEGRVCSVLLGWETQEPLMMADIILQERAKTLTA